MKPYKRIKFLNKKLINLKAKKKQIDLRFIGESFWLRDEEYNRLLNQSEKLDVEIQRYKDELEVLRSLLNFYNITIAVMLTIIIATGMFSLGMLIN